MTHCRVPPEPSVRARERNERSLFHSIGRCVRVEERQRPHTTYTVTRGETGPAAAGPPLCAADRRNNIELRVKYERPRRGALREHHFSVLPNDNAPAPVPGGAGRGRLSPRPSFAYAPAAAARRAYARRLRRSRSKRFMLKNSRRIIAITDCARANAGRRSVWEPPTSMEILNPPRCGRAARYANGKLFITIERLRASAVIYVVAAPPPRLAGNRRLVRRMRARAPLRCITRAKSGFSETNCVLAISRESDAVFSINCQSTRRL
ncbi:hypothetical protein EVAR_98152_1 [Eumeta japonica]|uniref:Uncharacterized protein n=1 Tax=Eumeta variegata TaxID=151549 RepID=A0A4C1XNY1_EUMVA|nr:hypothetical protein EVAR_98152_1 [Eumeta japonica]